MRSGIASVLVAVGVIGVSLMLGLLAGAYVWWTLVEVAAWNDGDPVDYSFAMFDGDAVAGGLITTLVTTLVTCGLLGWGVRMVSRRGARE